MELKLKKTVMGCLVAEKRPLPPNLSSLDAKIVAHKTAVMKERAHNGFMLPDKGMMNNTEYLRQIVFKSKSLKYRDTRCVVRLICETELTGKDVKK